MLYRLLRNNRESGPFSAVQLKEMGLKPYDLLWTEGRGAAWQYASEITELKDFAPSVDKQPLEGFSKHKEVAQVTQPVATDKKVKPRYRISNGQIIMVEAGSMEVGTNGIIKETVPVRVAATSPVITENEDQPDWQHIYPQWQPQALPKKEVEATEPVEIETKYSESLDDLKKRYAEKVLGDKKESFSSSPSSGSAKQNIMAVLALIVLVAGGYIGYTLKKKDTAVTSGQAALERADIAGNNSNETQPTENGAVSGNDNIAPDDNGTTSNSQVNNDRNTAKTAINTVKSTSPASVKDDSKKTVAEALSNQSTETVAKTSAAQQTKTGTKPVETVVKSTAKPDTNTGSEKSNTATTNPLPTAPVAKPVNRQISDYVSVKKLGGSASGVQNVKLMVSNVSDFPIDLAVVDIQYFDSKGKYQKGETMYVKDINGGNNVEVRVPDSDRASSIKYKVSMVQADQKTLYMVAD